MKGQSSELMNIVILVVSIAIILLLSYFLFTRTGISIRKNLVTESQYETTVDITTAFYNAKISGSHRSLSQLTGDRIVLGEPIVPYGIGFGAIDVDTQLTNFFNFYFGDRWALVFNSDRYNNFELGSDIPTFGNKVAYNILVPLPNIGKTIVIVDLYVW